MTCFCLLSLPMCCICQLPRVFSAGSGQGRVYGCAWEITEFSLQTLLNCQPGILNKIQEWQGTHNCYLLDSNGNVTKVCFAMPIHFAVLAVERAMLSWGFPIYNTTSRLKPGASFLEPLWRDHVRANDVSTDDQRPGPIRLSNTDSTLEIADLLRMLRSGLLGGQLPALDAQLLSRVEAQITDLHSIRVRQLQAQRSSTHKAYSIFSLLRHVLAAGFLRNGGNLKHVVSNMFAALSTEEQVLMRDYLQVEIAIPSAATLLRHRITIHAAYCSWMREVMEELMRGCHITRCTTVDSSPQGGYDWVLWGHIVMRNDVLEDS